jgi:hypothetical protein
LAALVVDPLAQRVAARWAKKEEIPVYNRDKDRIVNVLPKTQVEKSDLYEKVPDSRLDHDKHVDKHAPRRRQPHLPQRPKKPHRPMIPRHPPPSPTHPPMPPKPHMAPKPPVPVPHLKPPKVPEPSEQLKYKRVKKYLQASEEHLELVASVLERVFPEQPLPG